MTKKTRFIISFITLIAIALISGLLLTQGLVKGQTQDSAKSAVKSSKVKSTDNPTIKAILAELPTQADFEARFNLARKDKTQPLTDYFIITDGKTGEDGGFMMINKHATDGGGAQTTESGEVIDGYQLGDPRGAWVEDIIAAYQAK